MKHPLMICLAFVAVMLIFAYPNDRLYAQNLSIDPVSDVTIIEGELRAVIVTVSNVDPDGTLTITPIGTLPDFVLFDGTDRFAIAPQAGDSGTYTISFIADDTTEITQASFKIIVAKPSPTPTHTPTVTPTPTITPTPEPLTVTGSEPRRMTSGAESNITVFGTNFTDDSVVRIVGVGLAATTFVNGGSLIAVVPRGLRASTYTIQVSDTVHGTANSPHTLRIDPAPAPTRIPTITPFPPTPRPGLPELIISGYNANPQQVPPAGTTTFTITLVNQGSRTAQSVNISVDPASPFVPSSQQANVLLPDILPGASYTFSLVARASSNAQTGTNTIPMTLSYRDFEERQYSTTAVLSAELLEADAEVSRLTLTGYNIEPASPRPGQPVRVTVYLTNTGSEIAAQALLTVPVANGILLAGPQGSDFPLGDIPPGMTLGVELPLIVSASAESGIQPQTLNLTYLQGTTAVANEANMTLNIQAPPESALFLDSYSIGAERIQPGASFTLTATLINAGEAPVRDALVSFQSTDAETPSVFVPIGAGSTQVIAEILPDANGVTFTQDFIVNGTAVSDIYELPMNITYINADGSVGEIALSARIIVAQAPRLRFLEDVPMPDTIRVNDAVDFSITVLNLGRTEVQTLEAHVLVSNGEVITDEMLLMRTLRVGDEYLLEGSVLPYDEGDMTITFEILYINDLNQEETLIQSYNIMVIPAPPPPPTAPPRTPQTDITTFDTTPQAENFAFPENWLERLLLGLLGLGS